MAEIIIYIILLIPVYAVLIWTYMEPEESMLFGERWMYDREPEFSKRAIRFAKFGSLMVMILIPSLFISILTDMMLLKLLPVAVVLVLAGGIFKILAYEDE